MTNYEKAEYIAESLSNHGFELDKNIIPLIEIALNIIPLIEIALEDIAEEEACERVHTEK